MRKHIERAVGLLSLTWLAACGAPPEANLTVGDMATPLHWVDLAVPQPDLALTPPDLAMPDDLAMAPPDIAQPADMAASCTPKTTPCDVLCQDCGAGQKCKTDSANKPTCTADGTLAEGQPCGTGSTDDCAAGNVCVVAGSSLNLCRHYCRTDADCTGGRLCTLKLKSGAMVCSDPVSTCNPVKQTGCSGGNGCYIVDSAGHTGCHATGRGGYYDSCKGDYDCGAGLMCDGYECVDTCKSDFDCDFLFESCNKIGSGSYGYCY